MRSNPLIYIAGLLTAYLVGAALVKSARAAQASSSAQMPIQGAGDSTNDALANLSAAGGGYVGF